MRGNSKREFRLTPGQEKFVSGAEVQANAAQHDTAQHNTTGAPFFPQNAGKPKKVPLHPFDTQFGTSTYNFKFPAEMYAMALWLGAYAPGGPSLAELIRLGLKRVLPEMVDIHYKPDEK